MKISNPFRKKEPPVPPMKRVENAIDELNEAIRALPNEHKNVRPYVQSGSYITGRRAQVSLGYWEKNGDLRFVVTHGPKEI